MHGRARSHQTTQTFIGVLIIAVGILLFLDNLDIMESDDILQWWPVLLIAVGLVKLFQSGPSGGRGFGFILVVVGVVILLNNLDLTHIRLWDLWPILIVLIGGSMIWRAVSERRERARVAEGGADEDVRIDGSAFLGGFSRGSSSRDFQGGSLTAVMGGCEIDLRNASMKGPEATVDVFAFWGGIELKVPRDWVVVVEATPILGGIEDKTRPSAETSKRLIIKGMAIMGGIEIKN
jgi:predicted membrane protein